jgi:hypothetical protein
MFIHVLVDEFEEEFQKPWKAGLIKNMSIDYATNAIHGWYEDRDVIVFKFTGYGFINDNRHCTYSLSYGKAGITILIEK